MRGILPRLQAPALKAEHGFGRVCARCHNLQQTEKMHQYCINQSINQSTNDQSIIAIQGTRHQCYESGLDTTCKNEQKWPAERGINSMIL
jgi:hypothetical protein